MPFLDPEQHPVGPSKLSVLDESPASPGNFASGEAPDEEVAVPLSDPDAKILERIRRVLAEHLGSDAAGFAWLNSPGTGYPGTALDAISQGHAALVLEDLEAQWGPGPSYA